ncbi:ABC transporter ATP-binding protein [Eubacteriales bacterium OttesenSCG-928-A19]|nr:ABC transporter ATP-binding protein [Eubacteriales bacterium OttesenSCG-928-A19]
MNPVIRFEHVRKSYGEQNVLPDFSLDVEHGAFLTVIGSSGCGKTTMLKMINGLILPDSGSIYVEGRDIAGEDLIALRRRIGYVIQSIGLFPHMTIAENIAYVPNLQRGANKKGTRERALELLQLVGLDADMAGRYPAELSGGQQQRVGIARALAASPDILLMDEPFGAVDEITRKQLQQEIKDIHQQQGVTIVFITHDIKEALLLGTKVLVMHAGQIMQYDTPEAIQAHPANEFVRELVVE